MQVIKASKIVLLLWAILAIKQVDGKNIISDDSITTASSIQTNYLLRQIDFEKNRIAYHYKVADRRFFVLVDSVSEFIAEQDVPPEKKNLYLERLGAFLKNIHRSYSENYFRSGTYYALLGYYPRLIEWDQSYELLRNLNRYSSFSIKAAQLIPSDTIAEEFLFSYLNDYPDDIFRYVEGFDDRKFAMPL